MRHASRDFALRRDRALRLARALAFAGLALLGGCVTESSRSPPPEIFDFSGSLSGALLPSGTYHNTALIIELDEDELARRSPPAGDGLPAPALSVVLPSVEADGSELYVLPGGRELRYANGRWSIGFFNYAQGRGEGGRLYVFQTRKGDFEFSLHGQPVVIEASGTWVPSLFYSTELEGGGTQESTSRLPGVRRATYRGESFVAERIRVGRAEIRTDGRSGLWTVNGQTFRPQVGGPPLIIEDVVPVVAP